MKFRSSFFGGIWKSVIGNFDSYYYYIIIHIEIYIWNILLDYFKFLQWVVTNTLSMLGSRMLHLVFEKNK